MARAAVYSVGIVMVFLCLFIDSCKNKVTNHLPFDPDSLSFSSNWKWTGDSRGGGSQASISFEGDTLTIAPVEHVHFVNTDNYVGNGYYSFKFTGRYFKFAWKISPGDSSQGTGLIFQKDSGNQLALIHVKWGGFYYGWHNSGDQFRSTVNYPFDSTSWHAVEIYNSNNSINITFDGDTLDFFNGQGMHVDSFLVDVAPGYPGIGNSFNSAVKFLELKFKK